MLNPEEHVKKRRVCRAASKDKYVSLNNKLLAGHNLLHLLLKLFEGLVTLQAYSESLNLQMQYPEKA